MVNAPESPEYARRVIDGEIDDLIAQLPAIALEGARGVGKTTTASQRAATIYELDALETRNALLADPKRILDAPGPVLIDEWQFVPSLWDIVRRAVDRGAMPGSFLLTGSSSPTALGTHSGAGRIVIARMRPMSIAERLPGAASVSLADLMSGRVEMVGGETDVSFRDYVEEILRSGLPGIRDLSGRARTAQLDGYVSRIVDRDFPELGLNVRNPSGLRRWMSAYAAATSTSTSFEKIRGASTAGHEEPPAKSTIIPYRDILERLWIIEPIEAWVPSRSQISRLSHPPKHQLVDPAIAARLLGVDEAELTAAGAPRSSLGKNQPLVESLFESLVALSIRTYAQQSNCSVRHFRTRGGEREIDLIVERGDGRVTAIEVKAKHSIDDDDVRHLKWLKSRIGEELLDTVIVTMGPTAYRRPDGVAVVPAALLGA